MVARSGELLLLSLLFDLLVDGKSFVLREARSNIFLARSRIEPSEWRLCKFRGRLPIFPFPFGGGLAGLFCSGVEEQLGKSEYWEERRRTVTADMAGIKCCVSTQTRTQTGEKNE